MGSDHFGAHFVSSRKEVSIMASSTGKMIADNRRASFDYFLEDRFEAGISLLGTEIKSLRKHSVNIKDSYVTIKEGEAYVIDTDSFQFADYFCRMFTVKFLDPLLCDTKANEISLAHPHHE